MAPQPEQPPPEPPLGVKRTTLVFLVGLLGIAFIILKLCGVIAWPWEWVLAPLWIAAGIGALIVTAFVAFVAIALTINKKAEEQ